MINILNIVLATIVLEVAAVLLYLLVFRRWYCRWGATAEEHTMKMPEDDLAPNPFIYMTHAIDINAPPHEVWPWLKQMGQGRGGFYSYDWLERLFGFGIHNVYRIVPELQELKVGDHLRLHRNGMGATVETLEENRKMVLWMDSRELIEGRKYFVPIPKEMYIAGYWSFTLIEKPGGSTRLLERWAIEWPPKNVILDFFLIALSEVPSFIMERKMLKVIKMCAEGNPSVS